MKHIEALVFDCDGIVVDSEKLQIEAEQQTIPSFADEHQLPYQSDELDWDSMRGWARKKIAASVFGVAVDSDIADQFRLAVVEKTVEITCSDNTPLIPGVVGFIDYMKLHSIKMGLATASHRDIYTQYCAVNAMDFFPADYIVAYGECRDDKPKPGPYLEVIRRMNVLPESTLIAEDSDSGIMAGRFAGAIVLGVGTTKTAEHLRINTGAHLVAGNFTEAAYQLQPLLPR